MRDDHDEDLYPWTRLLHDLLRDKQVQKTILVLGAFVLIGFVSTRETACNAQPREIRCANACGKHGMEFHVTKYDHSHDSYNCFCRPVDGSASKKIW